MAKKDKAAAVDGEEEPKKKKPIKPILIVVVALVGVKFFVLKDPPPTPEQIKAAAKKVQEELYNTCAEANGLPTLADLVDGGKDPSASSTDKPKKSETATTAKKNAAARSVIVHYQLIVNAAAAPELGPIVPNDQSVTVNLQDGNFLKVGLAIQLPLGGDPKLAKEEGMLAEATDLALRALVPHDIKELWPQSKRDEIKDKLSFDTCRDTKGKILKILFTEFVFQNAQ